MADIVRVDDASVLERAARVIQSGGVVAIPTETFYGLAADWRNPAATARIFDIKGRPASMQLPLVAASLEQVIAVLGALDAATARAAGTFWPGPLSLILPAAGSATAAVRVPGHDFARRLCERAGALLTATSANRTGEPPADTAEAVEASLGEAVDLIVDGGRTPGGKPSTLADLRGPEPRVIREGAIDWNDVLRVLKGS